MNVRALIRFVCIAAMLLFASQLFAAQRVLIRFDESGHHVHRVVPIAEEQPVPRSDTRAVATKDSSSQQRYAMQLQWYDSAGNLLATNYLADPRISHAPSQKSSVRPTFVRLLSGAYVVTGPDQSTQIQINLPERFDVGLAAEVWQITLLR